ncbi:hypothetical protein [Natrinema pallidum]|uniref:Uncharacterized protein n=2 Tax=Natrinema pallidum TaxID=69527 RepID=L9Z7W5_9EURY|nr:hypothetical protein [Natrinema pallidum]ELY82444.1 hypothetical protein C487_01961 [Natrinema pallidum DSM 3751]QCW04642.1 hypothetical protein FGF80_16040 [Natrinema pallidum]
MGGVKRLYDRTDAWLRGLSRGRYAAVLGLATGIGVLAVGFLLSRDLLLVQAVTMALVMFGLECAFGRWGEYAS